MKELYKSLIEKLDIYDYFSYLEDYPYSKKYQIIKKLLNKYTTEQINYILYNFKQTYIDTNTVDYMLLEKQIKTIAKKYY